MLSRSIGRRVGRHLLAKHVSQPRALSTLVRDVISASLYGQPSDRSTEETDTTAAYFERQQLVVSPPPLDFRAMNGEIDWQRAQTAAYEIEGEGWTTPVELFKPHYAAALGTYLLQSKKSGVPLQIVEFGGGNGTCASGILNHLQAVAPSVYASMRYSIVDISAAMLARCQEVAAEHSCCTVHHVSAMDWNEVVKGPCHVIALEMLDNMPHDKVVWDGQTWHQTMICDQRLEHLEALEDPLIQRALDLWLDLYGTPEASWVQRLLGQEEMVLWLPTTTLRFVEMLRDHFAESHLLLADFDQLPSTIPGTLGPVVQSRDGTGGYKDHSTYLVEPGSCDIFFPTDFKLMQHMLARVCNQDAKVMKSKEFFEAYAKVSATRTASGYNPLLNDFKNTSILLS